MTEYQLGGAIEAEQRCVTFWGSAAGLEVTPRLVWGSLHMPVREAQLRPITPPQTCQKSVGLGGSGQSGRHALARAPLLGSFTLDFASFRRRLTINTRMVLVSRSPAEGLSCIAHSYEGATSAF